MMTPQLSTATQQQTIVAEAMKYAALGWNLVPLYGVAPGGVCDCRKGAQCPSAGKHPRLTDWGNKATCDEEIIAAWADEWQRFNIGLKLGPDSGIVDIEFDCDEGRATADRLLANAVTPSYQSSRSVHRLFKWRADLPIVSIRKVFGLECRLGNNPRELAVQSVLPPSQHGSGFFYRWLMGLSAGEVEVADLPEELFAMLTNLEEADTLGAMRNGHAPSNGRAIYVPGGVPEGGKNGGPGRNTAVFSFACREVKRIPPSKLDDPTEREDLLLKARGVNAIQCNPQMSDDEVRRIVESALRTENEDRVARVIPAPRAANGSTPVVSRELSAEERTAKLAEIRSLLGGTYLSCPEIAAIEREGDEGATYTLVMVHPRTQRLVKAKKIDITIFTKVAAAIMRETGIPIAISRADFWRVVLPLMVETAVVVETMTAAEAAEIWIGMAMKDKLYFLDDDSRDGDHEGGGWADDEVRAKMVLTGGAIRGWRDPKGNVCLIAEGVKAAVKLEGGDSISPKMAAEALKDAGFTKRREVLWLPPRCGAKQRQVWIRPF